VKKPPRRPRPAEVQPSAAVPPAVLNLRALSAEILDEVLNKGAKLKSKLDQRQKKVTRESDRALIKEIVSGCLRNLPVLDLSIKEFLKKGIEETDPFLLSLLRVGAYQIFYLDRIPVYAAVNECVEAAKSAGMKPAAGFVNTVLRNISKRKDELLSLPYRYSPPLSLSFKYGMPPWLVERYLSRFGPAEGEALIESMNRPAQNSIVFFSSKDLMAARPVLEREGYRLEEDGLFPLTFRVKGRNPADSEAFLNGLFYICDPASQLPAAILPSLKEGAKVLDLCAAPGTKSLLISKRTGSGVSVTASDISRKRVELLRENIARFRAGNIFPVVADAEKSLPFKSEFDACVLDAPCSSMGTIKRAPELRWQATGERFRLEGARQLKMLVNASETLREGGFLLYSVCSAEEEETTAVAAAFMEKCPGFSAEKIKMEEPLRSALAFPEEHLVYLFPHRHAGDGFFAALFRRKIGRKS